MAIFSAPHTGSEVALGFWSVILSAIAMLIAGRQTGSCVRLSGHSDGRRHGMIMFGLTVTSTVVLMKLGSMLLIGFPGINAAARGSDFMNIFTASGWVTFAALFVGFLGAIIGAMLGERSKTQEHIEPREIRPAA
ncbi:MAG TPA: hypothetical protein VMB49_19240 [Acidobacteriaceae bacterium]|nr:hypothetical protein [Acidobacteriaceae bacterium]